MLTVCCTSTSPNLTTLDAVKDLLGVIGSTDDEVLTDLLGRASAAVEAYLGYPLRVQTYQETVAAYDRPTLMLSRTPIVSVSRLFYGTDTGTAAELTSTQFRVEDADAGLVARVAPYYSFTWTAPIATYMADYVRAGSEYRPWLIEYAAGYRALAGTSTAAGTTSTGIDLPGFYAQATIETVKSWYLQRSQDSNLQSVKIGGLSMTLRAADEGGLSGGLPPAAVALLKRHRRSA